MRNTCDRMARSIARPRHSSRAIDRQPILDGLSFDEATMISRRIVLLMFGTAIAGAPLAIRCARSYAQQPHDVPAAHSGGTVVMLCDGKTSIEVKNLKPGQAMSRARAQAVSDE